MHLSIYYLIVKILKHSGNIVDYNRQKLKTSLLKSGAQKFVVEEVLNTIENNLYPGITTKQIYKLAFTLLKKSSHSHAARYNLRAALQMLGPAGFFFEKFITRLFMEEHYDAKINLALKGSCVNHEVDIALKKHDKVWMVECKFHNSRDTNSDVKVPMYILSRFNDLKANQHRIFSSADKISNCKIVTNNRFTTDAVTFAECSGLELLSWDYPPTDSLSTKIDNKGLYPVTCMTTLSIAEKEKLLITDVIMVREIINNGECLEKIGISQNRIKNVLKEASELCNYI